MRPQLGIEQVKALLTASTFVTSWRVLIADETTDRTVYKLRCQLLRSAYWLELRFIQTEEELVYSYQLFTNRPLTRWDNAPHFPSLKSSPHHFHEESGKVEEPPLIGDPMQDLPRVLAEMGDLLTKFSS